MQQAMKTYGGSGNMTPAFSTSMLVAGEWLASRPCYFTSPVSVDRKLDRPQSLSTRCGEEKSFFPLPEIEVVDDAAKFNYISSRNIKRIFF
jgi:hypothetical protein